MGGNKSLLDRMSHRAFMQGVREFRDPQQRREVLSPFPTERGQDKAEWDYKLRFWTSIIPRYLRHRRCMSVTGRELAHCFGCDMRTVGLALQELYAQGGVLPFGEYDKSEPRPLTSRLVFWKRSIPLRRCICPSTRWVFIKIVDEFVTTVSGVLRRDFSLNVLTAKEMVSQLRKIGMEEWIVGKRWNTRCIELYGKDLLVKRNSDGEVMGWVVERAKR